MTTDVIIEQVGVFSRFQMVLVALVMAPKLLMGWGMLMMSFAGTAPDWWCAPVDIPDLKDGSDALVLLKNNNTFEVCPDNNRTCRFVFSTDKNTIINEWNLVCDNQHKYALTTSIQMAGVLIGAFLGGQSADIVGRKPTFYLSLLLEGGFNLVAAFSTSWEMFTAVRFFIGMMIGSLLVVNYPYFMEFIGLKWRSISAAMPFWVFGVCLMAFSAWLRPDWSDQHIILAALHLPFLLGWFVAPESLRHLTVKGRLDEAEKVVEQMCRYNKKDLPTNTRTILQKVYEEEQTCSGSGKKYTYIDIFRTWDICWKSLVIGTVWMCMSLVYYGLAFGVGKLSLNLYLNIFLMSVVEVPAAVSVFFLANTIGRRWTCFALFATAAAGSFGVVMATRLAPEDQKGIIINVLALLAKLGVGAGWSAFQVVTSETYPTVVRNLGYGAANTAARIGGIIAPYVFAVEGDDVMIPFIIVGSTMLVCTVLCLLLPETKGIPLEDSTKKTVMDSSKSVEKSIYSTDL